MFITLRRLDVFDPHRDAVIIVLLESLEIMDTKRFL